MLKPVVSLLELSWRVIVVKFDASLNFLGPVVVVIVTVKAVHLQVEVPMEDVMVRSGERVDEVVVSARPQ